MSNEGVHMRKVIAGVGLVLLIAFCCGAFELTEVGFRVDLDLMPLRVQGQVQLLASIGAYIEADLESVWGMRAGIGLGLENVSPYASIGLMRSVADQTNLIGDLTFQLVPRLGLLSTIHAGVRYRALLEPLGRWSIESLPFRWILYARSGSLSFAFNFLPTFTVNGTLLLAEGGLFGQSVAVALQQISGINQSPLFSLGGGWIVSGRLTTTVGFIP